MQSERYGLHRAPASSWKCCPGHSISQSPWSLSGAACRLKTTKQIHQHHRPARRSCPGRTPYSRPQSLQVTFSDRCLLHEPGNLSSSSNEVVFRQSPLRSLQKPHALSPPSRDRSEPLSYVPYAASRPRGTPWPPKACSTFNVEPRQGYHSSVC